MSDPASRRSFLNRSIIAPALAAGPAVLTALGANNRIRAGWIGTGSRGNYLMERAYAGSGSIVEVQGTAEQQAFTQEQFDQLMALAKRGIAELVQLQKLTVA